MPEPYIMEKLKLYFTCWLNSSGNQSNNSNWANYTCYQLFSLGLANKMQLFYTKHCTLHTFLPDFDLAKEFRMKWICVSKHFTQENENDSWISFKNIEDSFVVVCLVFILFYVDVCI